MKIDTKVKEKTKAKLTKDKQGKLSLFLITKNSDPKLIFQDEELFENLSKLADLLKFKSVNELLDVAKVGDETILTLARKFENDQKFDFKEIEINLEDMYKMDYSKMTKHLRDELYANHIADLAASSIETMFENFVYDLITILHELSINMLAVESSNLPGFERLCYIIGQNMGLAGIDVNLE